MKKNLAYGIVGLFVASFFLFGCASENKITDNITNFEECVAAGNPVMESYPMQCRANGQTFVEEIEAEPQISAEDALSIANSSRCVENGTLEGEPSYNAVTKTWWINLDIDKEGCSPACVVYEDSMETEINWRCTGLI